METSVAISESTGELDLSELKDPEEKGLDSTPGSAEESSTVAGISESVHRDSHEDEKTDVDSTPEDATPESSRRIRDPLWAWSLVALGMVFILVASVATYGEKFFTARYENSIKKANLLAPEARIDTDNGVSVSIKGPLNFLLLGSDARDDDPLNGQRSDTIIILHVSKSMDRAYFLSVPRDLLVDIPPFPDAGFRGSREKINAALQYGGDRYKGVQLLSQTLSDMFDIQFAGAMIIDFAGFSKVVDLLGGVNLCVDARTESIHIGFDKDGNFLPPRYGPEAMYANPDSTPKVYEPGCRDFKGWEALDYVRQRKTLPGGDYDRQRHQQQFLFAIAKKAQSRGMLTKPTEIDKLIISVGNSLTAQFIYPIVDLVMSMRSIEPSNIVGIAVPSEPQMINGTSYIVALPEAEDLYKALHDDALEEWIPENIKWTNKL